MLWRLEQGERMYEERKCLREARQTWTATGKLRRAQTPVHRPLKPLKPNLNLPEMPGAPKKLQSLPMLGINTFGNRVEPRANRRRQLQLVPPPPVF